MAAAQHPDVKPVIIERCTGRAADDAPGERDRMV